MKITSFAQIERLAARSLKRQDKATRVIYDDIEKNTATDEEVAAMLDIYDPPVQTYNIGRFTSVAAD